MSLIYIMVKQTQLANTNTGAFLFSNTKSCMNGGGYGVTFDSLKQASQNGLGRSSNASVKYNSCPPQTGGSMADVNNNSMTNSYGYLNGNNETNSLFRGSYAAVDKHPTAQSCGTGGRKKRRKKRKSRRRRRKTNKRRKRYNKSKKRNKKGGYEACNTKTDPDHYCRLKAERAKNAGNLEKEEHTKCNMMNGECVKPDPNSSGRTLGPVIDLTDGRRSRSKKSRSKKSRGKKSRSKKSRSKKSRGKKSRSRKSRNKKSRSRKSPARKKMMKGGSSINYSIIDNTLKGENARILGSHSYTTNDNCGDGYNHYTGGNVKSLY